MKTDWKKKYEQLRGEYEELDQWCTYVESNRQEAIAELQYTKGQIVGLEKALKIVNGPRD